MLLFLFGADTYRSREKLKEITGKYEPEIKKGTVELKKFDGADLIFFDLKDAAEAASLFCSKKIMIISGACDANSDTKDKLSDYLPGLAKSKDLVIFFDSEPDGRDKLFKALKKAAKCQEFSLLSPQEIKKWIDEKIKSESLAMKADISISADAKDALVNFIGPDLWQMESEINKLILYKHGGSAKEKITIDLEDLEALIKPHIKTYIFKTIDAISSKNKKEALGLLHEHLSNKENEFYIFTMIVWQMRNLVQIKDLVDKGMPFSMVAKKTGISPYVINKNLPVLKKIAFSKIKLIYDYLLYLDIAMKTGKIDSALALDMFIFKFSF